MWLALVALPSLGCAYLSTPHGTASWSSRAPAARLCQLRCCQDAVPEVGTCACTGYVVVCEHTTASAGEGFVCEIRCVYGTHSDGPTQRGSVPTHPSHTSAGPGDGSANSAWRTGGCLCFPKRAPIRAALSLARPVALSCRSQSCKHGRRLACSQTMCCQVLFWDLTRQWRQANGKYT